MIIGVHGSIDVDSGASELQGKCCSVTRDFGMGKNFDASERIGTLDRPTAR